MLAAFAPRIDEINAVLRQKVWIARVRIFMDIYIGLIICPRLSRGPDPKGR